MKNLIQTKIPNVYAVKVPMEWCEFEIANGSNMILFKINDGFDNELSGEIINLGHYNTFKNNFKILGTITKSEISFDASEIVESKEFSDMDYDGNWIEITRYWDYEYKQFSAMDSDESFRSALPEEIVWDNPLDENEHTIGTIKSIQWQSAQEQITDKLLILQKV